MPRPISFLQHAGIRMKARRLIRCMAMIQFASKKETGKFIYAPTGYSLAELQQCILKHRHSSFLICFHITLVSRATSAGIHTVASSDDLYRSSRCGPGQWHSKVDAQEQFLD